ncbi:ATP-binding protein [Streptomyces sp. 7N604]|uniref:ATP-binding protein n=1 Tax=Streptomyces sp. 7N604 TaxID=3457415 RepID=UPI003FD1171A
MAYRRTSHTREAGEAQRANHRERGKAVHPSATDNVTTHELGNGLVQHRWVDLSRYNEPQVLAREQVRQALSGRASGSRIDDAVLVVNELVTNARQHAGGGPSCMNLDVYEDIAVMWIHDCGKDAEAVRLRTSAADVCTELGESGRGLYLVEVLAAKWFVWPTVEGKAVVAVIELDAANATPPTLQ